MIKLDEYGTYGSVYNCPVCHKDHGMTFHHITKQNPILCDDCLNDDKTDINLRIKTILHYIVLLRGSVEDISHTTSGLRVF